MVILNFLIIFVLVFTDTSRFINIKTVKKYMIGIYKIIINGKAYVGSSFDIERRLIQHKSDLNCKRHDNTHLQNAYNKYKHFNSETIEVFDSISDEELRKREDYWKKKIGYYNIQDPVTHFGLKKIYQFDLQGNLIREFQSANEAAEKLGVSYSNIIHAAQENEKDTRTAAGYFWRYTPTITFEPDKRKTPIYVYDIEGNYLKEYEGIMACAKDLFPDKSSPVESIVNVCNGICASVCGYRFSKEKLDKLDNSKLLSIMKNYPVVQVSSDGKYKIKVWNTAKEAATFLGCKSCEITQACKKNCIRKGYRWMRLGTKSSELLETLESIEAKTELETVNEIA